jgi:hypothetical protein
MAVVIAVVTINIIAIPYQIYAQPTTQGNAITGIKVGGHPYAIAVDPKTNAIFVAGILPKKIFTIDGSSNKQVSLSNTPAFNASVKIFPYVAVSSTAGPEEIQNLTGPEMNCYIDMIPTGTSDHDVIKFFKTYVNIPAIILT